MTARAIRYYEEHALIASARDRRGARLFDQHAVDRLVIIGQARRAGLSIVQVLDLLSVGDRQGQAGRTKRAMQLLTARLVDLDAQRAAVEQCLSALSLCEGGGAAVDLRPWGRGR